MKGMAAARNFFAWWGAELNALVPSSVAARFATDGRPLVLDLTGKEAIVEDAVTGRRQIVGAWQDSLGAAELAVDLRRTVGGSANVLLRPDRRRFFDQHVELPAAAEGSIGQVLGFEMDRLTPFSAEEVYFVWRIIERNRALRRLKLAVTLAPREAIDPTLALVRAWGIDPVGIELQPESNGILILRGPTLRSRRLRRLQLIIMAITVALGVTLAWVQLDRKERSLTALENTLATAKAEADATEGLRAEIERARLAANYVTQRKIATPMATYVLNEVARRLPDHSWIAQLRLEADTIEIIGFSRAVTDVVNRLTADGLFQRVAFRSPVTRDARDGIDRFHLGAKLVGEHAP